MTRRCQFTVRGTEIVGVIYVTCSGDDESAIIKKATVKAMDRSGDPRPEFIRFV